MMKNSFIEKDGEHTDVWLRTRTKDRTSTHDIEQVHMR